MKRFLAVLLLGLGLINPAAAASNNILFILADDMGIDMATFYRTSIRFATTPASPALPELAALANSGIVFSRAWVTPWCSPTRAAILTGRYGFRTGLGEPIDDASPDLQTSELTLPEIITASSPRDYVQRHIGKWHLSDQANGPRLAGWPNATGPNPGYGGFPDTSGENYFSWQKFTNGTSALSTTYTMTDYVNEAINTINSANTANKPYFIWLAPNNIHAPFHKPPNSLITMDSLPATGGSDRSYIEAMDEALDTEIGRLLDSVNLTTTTVIFVGDNGTPTGQVASPYLGTHSKGTPFTGGVHVPMIIAGQGVSDAGRYVQQMVYATDIFATILDLAGVNIKTAIPATTKIDGTSLVPYMADKPNPNERKYVYTEEFTSAYNVGWERVIRNDTFCLIERLVGGRDFYNIQVDPLETTDLLNGALSTYEQSNLDDLDAEMDRILATR